MNFYLQILRNLRDSAKKNANLRDSAKNYKFARFCENYMIRRI
ncbi:hypothetical protein [Helicobacter sp. 23-1045]